jgi:hypothetical protein
MYNIALITPYNETEHGRTQCTSKGIENHNIIVYVLELEDFYNNYYKNLISKNISLNIVELKELPGLEVVGIVKIMWLRILQKKIKNYLRQQ